MVPAKFWLPNNTAQLYCPLGLLSLGPLLLGQLLTRTTTNQQNYSPGPIPVWWGIVLVGSSLDVS